MTGRVVIASEAKQSLDEIRNTKQYEKVVSSQYSAVSSWQLAEG
jgi:hypothetical protein